jgi:hypothetical protein
MMKVEVDYKAEMQRRNNKRMSMLRMFRKEGELTTKELNMYFGTGCSSRLHELREEGHVITAIYEKPGCYRYVYLGEKDEE